MGIEF
jgi:hypothetical protein